MRWKWIRQHESLLFVGGSMATLTVAGLLLAFGTTGTNPAVPKERIFTSVLDYHNPHSIVVESSLPTAAPSALHIQDSTGTTTPKRSTFRTPTANDFYALPHSSQDPAILLSEDDKEHYKKAFEALHAGDWRDMNRALAQVENKLLIPHVMAEKFLHNRYASTHQELVDWMREHQELPQARRIAKLAKEKRPNMGIRKVSVQNTPYLYGYGDSNGLSGRIENRHAHLLNWTRRSEAQALWKQIFRYMNKGMVTRAYTLLQSDKARDQFKPIEIDLARWSIANSYYAYGSDEEALETANLAAKRSGERLPGIHWTAGLAAWRMGYIADAAEHFSKHAELEQKSEWDISAGAYWAYRAYRSLASPAEARRYLRIASRYPRTFYGILARYESRQPLEVELPSKAFSEQVIQSLLERPAVQRAIALVEVDQHELAERELRNYFPQTSGILAEAMLQLAHNLDIPAVQIRMARSLSQDTTEHQTPARTFDFARYPMPHWTPGAGYRVDPALIYGLVRQESGFNTHARSYKGARGLMQIMPATARYVAQRESIVLSDKNDLFDPHVNIELGQAYLAYLLSLDVVENNLFFALTAYNAGPGKLSTWKKEVLYHDDPLLFIESIPVRETRNYIEQVMANFWMYRHLNSQPVPSILSLINGKWPQYTPIEYEFVQLERQP